MKKSTKLIIATGIGVSIAGIVAIVNKSLSTPDTTPMPIPVPPPIPTPTPTPAPPTFIEMSYIDSNTGLRVYVNAGLMTQSYWEQIYSAVSPEEMMSIWQNIVAAYNAGTISQSEFALLYMGWGTRWSSSFGE